MTRLAWEPILERAHTLVESYDTGVTLRQLFYRLVSEELLPNAQSAYKTLSARTAEERRAGAFPDLIDRGRMIHRPLSFEGPEAARNWLSSVYRRDRTENMDTSIYIGVEKVGMVEQLSSWFENLGVPVVALSGYSSQTYVNEVERDASGQQRPAVLLYAGDFDPSGEDIERDFLDRTGCFAKTVRVALTSQQVIEYGLPPLPGKSTDSRARAFTERHGRLVQVELDALDPDVLRGLFENALGDFWDVSTYEANVRREDRERDELVERGRR